MTTNIAIDSTTSSSSSLTRETVDALLQILSPRCKQALETALDSQWELSEACSSLFSMEKICAILVEDF